MLRRIHLIDHGERAALREELIERSKTEDSWPSSHNQGGWRSRDDLFARGPGPAAWLHDQLYRLMLTAEIRAWGIVNRRHAFHNRHRHRQDFRLSGVFYLDDGETPTVFETDFGVITIRPEAGLLVVFPVDVWHSVPPHGGDEPRVTVAFDAR